MLKKNLVIFTGAGISAESGINTFRDANGLWEGHDIMEVASPMGWNKKKSVVLDFYNKRRRQLQLVKPNAAHLALAKLEKEYEVNIITQNVDDLHERAGSTNIVHLHGELLKVRSTLDESYIIDWKKDLNVGDCCPRNGQLRPHIVWFGEEVPFFEKAIKITERAAIFAVIGTSLQVYPAAGLIHYTSVNCTIFYIDPKPAVIQHLDRSIEVIAESATQGVDIFIKKLKLLASHDK